MPGDDEMLSLLQVHQLRLPQNSWVADIDTGIQSLFVIGTQTTRNLPEQQVHITIFICNDCHNKTLYDSLGYLGFTTTTTTTTTTTMTMTMTGSGDYGDKEATKN